jgi:hypothetical protein
VSDAPATSEDPTLEDPKSTLSYRLARAAVIILGVLLVIALVLLVVGLAFKMTNRHPAAESGSIPAIYTLAPGARVVSVDSQPGRLILRVRTQAGDEVDIVDTESGRLVGQVKSAGPTQK